MKKIAILGLGIIGMAWARHLHQDGLEVRGWNRTPKDEPFSEPDIVKAVDGADLIFLIVADPAAVQSLLDQILPHLKPGQLVAQSSTISADWTKKFAAQVEQTGAAFLEAPFTGSKPAAEARKVVFYLGGDPALAEKAAPVLDRISQKTLHIGPLGTASSLKLAMNLNIANVSQSLSEALTLARKEGISDETFFQALEINVGRSGFSDLKQPKFRTRDYAPQFSAKHLDKDLRLALETAGDLDLPATKRVKALYESALQQGMGEDDFIGLIRLLETKKK